MRGNGLHAFLHGPVSGCDTPREEARLLLAAIEGAMITAPERSAGPYVDTLQRLVDSVVT